MKKIILFLIIIFFLFNFSLNISLADPPGDPAPIKITNPLGDEVTPQKLIGKIIEAALGIVGSIALLMFIYGGFTWMLAAGNAEAVSKGKNILIWSVIGLVIIFSSYALVKFVFTSIGA
jgi:hypothetical protein